MVACLLGLQQHETPKKYIWQLDTALCVGAACAWQPYDFQCMMHCRRFDAYPDYAVVSLHGPNSHADNQVADLA